MKIALQSSPFNRNDLFEEEGFEVVEGPRRSEQQMIELLHDADGAQVGVMPLTSREVMLACPKLKVVSRMGVGVDSIDLQTATELGILVCNVPGVNTAEVADHAVAMLLSLTRRIHDSVLTTRDGAWGRDRRLTVEYMRTVRRIAGHTVGIIGFDDIGRALQCAFAVSGQKIVAYDPYVPQTTADLFGVELGAGSIVEESDYVSVHFAY